MKEKELINSFSHFLITQKGFSQDCLAYDYGFRSNKGDFLSIDLIVFDDKVVNQPLAIVEFQTNIPAEGATTEKTKKVLNYVGEVEVPAYLICPSESDFWIYELSGGLWKRLDKSEFPNFKKLKDILAAKVKLKEFEDAQRAKEKARKLQIKKAYTSLLSVILAVIVGLVTTIALSGLFSTDKDSQTVDKEIVERINNLEENLQANEQYADLFSDQLSKIMAAVNSKKDSIQSNLYYQNELFKIDQTMDLIRAENSDIETELAQLKRIISKDQLYLIELKTIRTDITLLENELHNDVKIIKRDLGSIDDKYNFLVGGIITLIISIVILALPNLIQGLKNSRANP